MTVILGDVIFLHVPKTGGTWIRAALGRSRPDSFLVLQREDGERHLYLKEVQQLLSNLQSHTEYRGIRSSGKEAPQEELLKRLERISQEPQFVSFIRHPLSWWTSFWRYRQSKGWDDNNEIDVQCKSENFNTFIENVIRLKPGACSRLFRRFIGAECTQGHLVGTQEYLREDIAFLLQHFGFLEDASITKELQALNVSSASAPGLQEDLKERLLETERDIIHAFYTPEARSLKERIDEIPEKGSGKTSSFSLD